MGIGIRIANILTSIHNTSYIPTNYTRSLSAESETDISAHLQGIDEILDCVEGCIAQVGLNTNGATITASNVFDDVLYMEHGFTSTNGSIKVTESGMYKASYDIGFNMTGGNNRAIMETRLVLSKDDGATFNLVNHTVRPSYHRNNGYGA